MAETNVAGPVAGDADDEGASQRLAAASRSDDSAPERAAAPADATPAPYADAPPSDGASPAAPTLDDTEPPHVTPTRPTRGQRKLPRRKRLAKTLVWAVALAPLVIALLAALGAFITEGVAAIDLAILFRRSAFLQMGDPMNALSVASRVGFLAIGYLGLFCALMALLAGALGRGRGRLFIIPGALLTASALVLFAASIALCWPLVAPLAALPLPYRIGLLVIGAYVLLDTVALAAALADTRQTRRRTPGKRRAGRENRTRANTLASSTTRSDAPPTPPPTLASGV